MLMGSTNIISGFFYLFLIIRGTSATDPRPDTNSLTRFSHDYARKTVPFPQTGKFYDISLDSNYSGIKLSFIRIRSASLWTRGINSAAFHIPPKTRIIPFVKRLDIVFQDLSNLSSYYYNVPKYRFVTPVFGLATYNGEHNNNTAAPPPNISLAGNNTILIQFPDISVKKKENATLRCVTFAANGQIHFSNVTVPNRCLVYGQGHFSIVVPRSKHSSRKRLAIGLGVGFGCLILLLVVVLMWRIARRKKKSEPKQNKPEKSDQNLDSAWVGWSNMPPAEWARAEVPENDYVP